VIAGDGQRPQVRRLLRQPAYRRLWLARTTSQVGDVAQFTTLALLVVTLTGSGLGVSAVVLAEIVPVLAVAPFAGSVVDRLPRVRVMVSADLVRVVLAAALAVWHDSAGVAYAVAFGLSAGQVLFSPAAQSLLPSIVRDDELVAATAGSGRPPSPLRSRSRRSQHCSPSARASAPRSRSTPPATR
jgi:MFS family permease